ncbi:MAG: MmcB family DNA repair protein [Rhodomicrobium sp.]|nr:MmcB family DNA repair protein [Rhodomicrobium sp.]
MNGQVNDEQLFVTAELFGAAAQIARGVGRHFRALDCAVLSELALADGRRCDLMALDRQGAVAIVEIKSCFADFRTDRKWQDYRDWCDRFYFAVDADFPSELIPGDCGLIPELQAARRANVAGGGETTAGRVAETIGEVAGGSVLPSAGLAAAGRFVGTAASGILGQYARNPGTATGLDALSTVGAGSGVAAARENELGPVAEVAAGLIGGYAAPNAANLASRTAGGVKSGFDYGNRMVRSFRDPEQAAIDTVADRMVGAGADPAAMRASVQPQRSANLTARGFTEDDMAAIISRQMAGETAEDVVRDFARLVDARGRSLTPQTARNYYQRYRQQNPTPMNAMDLTKEIAGEGASAPVTRLGRASYSLSGDESGDAAQALISRQEIQPGRVSSIARQAVGGEDFEATRTAGLQNLEREAGQAYRQFYRQPDLAIDELADLMQDPLFRRANVMAQRQSRVEAIRRNQDAARQGRPGEPVPEVDPDNQVFSPEMLDYIQRQLRIASEGFANNPNNARHARNIRDVFLDRIERHYPEFRDIRRNYATGMGEFGADGALNAGREMTKRLGERADEAMRDFDGMTPAQQELFRLGFARQIMDDAANVQQGSAAANKFRTGAFEELVRRMWSGNAETRQAGEQLIRNLRREAITTKTKNDVLSGARTAELESDMGRLKQGAEAAADIATGRVSRMLEIASARLETQLGRRGATEVMRVLTETDPAQLLPILTRLSQSARSSADRNQLAVQLREFARFGRRPAAEAGVIGIQADQ